MTIIVGLDEGHDDVRAAEHWLHELVERLGHPAGLVACTHLVREPHPHVALSVATPTPVAGLPRSRSLGAAIAAGEHAARARGRAVVFPGMERLVGVVTAADLVATSAIDRIVILGTPGLEPPPDQEIETRDYIRPQWMDGALTLVTQPAAGGRLVPFEFRVETPCC